jgi:hypothetical protein
MVFFRKSKEGFMQVLEKAIERRFVQNMKRLGIVALKLNLSGNVGWPDRMILLPGGRPLFIEFKVATSAPRKIQRNRHKKLKDLGYEIRVFSCATKATRYVTSAAKVGALGIPEKSRKMAYCPTRSRVILRSRSWQDKLHDQSISGPEESGACATRPDHCA